MKKIPLDPSQSADQTVKFQTEGGLSVNLRFVYNVRSGFWNVDVSTSSAKLLGVKLVPGWPLLHDYRGQIDIGGDLLFLPVSSDARDYPIKYEDIGKVWFLCAFTKAESEAWRSARGLG